MVIDWMLCSRTEVVVWTLVTCLQKNHTQPLTTVLTIIASHKVTCSSSQYIDDIFRVFLFFSFGTVSASEQDMNTGWSGHGEAWKGDATGGEINRAVSHARRKGPCPSIHGSKWPVGTRRGNINTHHTHSHSQTRANQKQSLSYCRAKRKDAIGWIWWRARVTHISSNNLKSMLVFKRNHVGVSCQATHSSYASRGNHD